MPSVPPDLLPEVLVRPARPEDLARVLAILEEAARRMRAYGNVHGWPVPFPTALVQGPLQEGDTYLVARPDGVDVATVTLRWEDPRFWGVQPPVAGYLHRLAVRSAHAGRRYGPAILAWADGEVRRRGRQLLRLDTATSNAGLLQYYAALGFRRVGEVAHDPLRFPVTLLERPVSVEAAVR